LFFLVSIFVVVAPLAKLFKVLLLVLSKHFNLSVI
jgi:hypothetical protein